MIGWSSFANLGSSILSGNLNATLPCNAIGGSVTTYNVSSHFSRPFIFTSFKGVLCMVLGRSLNNIRMQNKWQCKSEPGMKHFFRSRNNCRQLMERNVLTPRSTYNVSCNEMQEGRGAWLVGHFKVQKSLSKNSIFRKSPEKVKISEPEIIILSCHQLRSMTVLRCIRLRRENNCFRIGHLALEGRFWSEERRDAIQSVVSCDQQVSKLN